MLKDHQLSVLSILGVTMTKGRCLPLKWDQRRHRFYLYQLPEADNFEIKIQQEKNRLSNQLRIHQGATLVLICQIVFDSVGSESGTSMHKMLNWATLLLCIMYHVHLEFCHARSADISAFMNGLLDCEKIVKQYGRSRRVTFSESSIILFALACPLTVLFLPVGLTLGLHWISPHKPTLIGYWILWKSQTIIPRIVKGP